MLSNSRFTTLSLGMISLLMKRNFIAVMVNNSTNIIKMSKLTSHLKSWNIKKDQNIWCWKSRSWTWERHTNFGWVKLVYGIPPPPLNNWISNNKCKQTIRNLQRFTSTKKDHTLILKMNDNINMDSTITRLMNACS